MEFFITWALILGLLVAPALVNYFVNRYYSPPGKSLAPTIELIAASLTLTFAVLVAAIVIVLGIALGWDDLKEELEAFLRTKKKSELEAFSKYGLTTITDKYLPEKLEAAKSF